MRKLASIQRVIDIQPIEGADKIEVATILGWKVVVKKGEFKVGDLCVYVEIDSILPEREEFEFMRERKFKVKTIKLRKQVSQGIAFPLSILPNYTKQSDYREEADVTDVLEIKKYEEDEYNKPTYSTNQKPIFKSSVKKWMPKFLRDFFIKYTPSFTFRYLAIQTGKRFPNWIPKTDETRVQVLQKLLNENQGRKFYITEKLDGSSMTCYLKDGKFGVCSRNIDLAEGVEGDNFWKVAREQNIEEGMRSCVNITGKSNYAIQGELIGEGIQGNKYGLDGQDFYVFNVYDIDSQAYLRYNVAKQLVTEMGLKFVPILDENFALITNIDTIVDMSKGKSVLNKNTHREGIVIRPCFPINTDRHAHVSFKAINPDFLLKYDL